MKGEAGGGGAGREHRNFHEARGKCRVSENEHEARAGMGRVGQPPPSSCSVFVTLSRPELNLASENRRTCEEFVCFNPLPETLL